MPADFGLTAREARQLRSLTPPIRLQRFLDQLDYDVAGGSCRSPRRALREHRVQCLDGALLAAAALRLQGQPALLFDLEAVQDDDHVLALFKSGGCWGAVGRSNYAGLRYREPVHRTLRELAVSYFDEYFNLRGERTLRRYSRPVSLRPFDALDWMTSEHDLWPIAEHLVHVRHWSLLTPAQERRLARVDRRRFHAGLHGRQTT